MSHLERLGNLLKQGKITRRDFIAQATALGLSAAISPAFFSQTAHAAPKNGGRLRIGTSGGSTTDSLDPATITDVMMQCVVYGQMGSSLTEVNHENKVAPELAESWESTPDAKVWRFKLRKGVEFHNGKSLDPDDVIYSFQHHMGEKSKSAAKAIVKSITEIKKEGNDTVVFTLSGGNADFPYIVSDYHLVITPKGEDFTKGIFSGAYKVKDFEPGVRSLVVKNKNYFKSDRGYFDEVETLAINDVNARTNALKTGQIDVMNRLERKTIHLMKRMPGIQVMQQDGNKHFTFAMRCDLDPYKNNEARLALKYAIDREQLLKTILRGYGTIANDHPIGRANRYFASEIPQRTYDPDKAAFHLKKSGLKDVVFKLHTAEAAFVGAVDAAIIYKEQAAKAGIKIDVVREPNDGYWSNVWMKKPWCAVFWGGRPTEDMMFSTAYAAGAPWNDTKWTHERFNKLLVEARAELDEKKRRSMYVDMQQIVRDEGGVVVPMYAADLAACSDKIGFTKLATNWELDGFRGPERWWFKG